MEYHVFLVRICICFLLSFFIGIERQVRRRSVGLRTSLLVSIGAFLFVLFSFEVEAGDLTRVAAQVVSGIGFLGAGVIIKDGFNVRGLATAATLWCNAALGVLCAGGFLLEASTGAIIVLFSNTILRYFNMRINNIKEEKVRYYEYAIELTIKPNQENIVNDLVTDGVSKKNMILYKYEISNLVDKMINLSINFRVMASKIDYVEEFSRLIKESAN